MHPKARLGRHSLPRPSFSNRAAGVIPSQVTDSSGATCETRRAKGARISALVSTDDKNKSSSCSSGRTRLAAPGSSSSSSAPSSPDRVPSTLAGMESLRLRNSGSRYSWAATGTSAGIGRDHVKSSDASRGQTSLGFVKSKRLADVLLNSYDD